MIMNGTVRVAAGAVAGVVTAMLVITGMEMLGHAILPADALLAAPLAAYFVATLLAGIVSIFVAGRRIVWLPVGIALLLAAATLANMLMMPGHPIWFGPAAAIVLTAGCWCGWRLTSGRV
jgi:hypothetical protein